MYNIANAKKLPSKAYGLPTIKVAICLVSSLLLNFSIPSEAISKSPLLKCLYNCRISVFR